MSLDELERRFRAAKGDYEQLKTIADALETHNAQDAQRLRFKVVAEMIRLKHRGGASRPTLPNAPVAAILSRVGLTVPDGRPLHRYRLDEKAYDDLRRWLRARAGLLADGGAVEAAALAMWGSNWFRLHYAGGVRNYRDLGADIGADLSDTRWRELLEQGLRFWRRELIMREGRRHRLLSIAVEGGFPVQVLSDQEAWLSKYLNKLVGRLLGFTGDISPEAAFELAKAMSGELRETYRQEAFIALAADLALAIVRLRILAEGKAVVAGQPPSTILDRVDPDWRRELPISADTEAARKLIDGMLAAEKIGRGLTGAAGCVRVLRKEGGDWIQSVRLSLAGEFRSKALVGLAEPGVRLGILPSGMLSRTVVGELAFLDPPGEDSETWLLRPVIRRTEFDCIPLSAGIEVLIQSPSGSARTMQWPGGQPELSDVLTFDIEAEDKSSPTVLVLIAQGSASVRSARVVVAAPAEWNIRWEVPDDGAPVEIGSIADGRRLWIVDRSVLVGSAGGGLLYRVRTGMDEAHRDRLELDGLQPKSFENANEIPLFQGAPTVKCYRGEVPIRPARGELLWRQSRADHWRELAQSPLPDGIVEILWRDLTTNFVRDRIRVAILPRAARVIRDRISDGCRYRFEGFGSIAISPIPIEGLIFSQATNDEFTLRFQSNPKRRVTFSLRFANSERSVQVSLPYPLRDGLAHWDGKIIPPGSEITPAELAELVAFGEHRLRLCCEIKNSTTPFPLYFVLGQNELSLRALAARVRGDLASAGIDAWVTLSIGDGTASWRVKLFDSIIRHESRTVTILRTRKTVGSCLAVVGRSVAQPSVERLLLEIGTEVAVSHHPINLPEDMIGPWMVYLRDDRAVRSRPSIVVFSELASVDGRDLASLSLIASPTERKSAIAERLSDVARGAHGATEEIAGLIALIDSLNGVPASTFDILSTLSDIPVALARLLLSADENSLARVWRLESELPFLWAAVPLRAWNAAADSYGQNLLSSLLAGGWSYERAVSTAKQMTNAQAEQIASLAPDVGTTLTAAGLLPKRGEMPTIHNAAREYVRRTYERGDSRDGVQKQTSIFRTEELGPHLPAWFTTMFDLSHLEALDAPIAVAAAAKFEMKLTPAQIRRCKEAAIEDPIYFSRGIAAVLLGAER